MKKKLYSIFAFLLLGFGISLQVKAGIGQSMFNALCLLLANLFNLEIGIVLNLLNLLFFLVYLILKNTNAGKHDFMQIAATLLNGYMINFYLYYLLQHITFPFYLHRLLLFFSGLILASFSLGAILAMEIIQFPLESLCLLLVRKTGHSLFSIRLSFECFFLLSTLLLTLTFSHNLYIREGTILSFLLLSKLIGYSYSFHKKLVHKKAPIS